MKFLSNNFIVSSKQFKKKIFIKNIKNYFHKSINYKINFFLLNKKNLIINFI